MVFANHLIKKIFFFRNSCSHRKASNGACSVNEWTETFPPTREKVKYKMTSVCGHVMSLDFIAKYNSWDK